MLVPRNVQQIVRRWKHEAFKERANNHTVLCYLEQTNDAPVQGTLTICTDMPGILIGKGGHLVYKYIDEIKNVETFGSQPTITEVKLKEAAVI